VSCPRNSMPFAAGQLAVFQGAERRAYLNRYVRSEQRGKNSQLAAAHRVAMKMGRRLRCSSVTSRPTLCCPGESNSTRSIESGAGCALLAPCRRPILIATNGMLFRGQDTRMTHRMASAFSPMFVFHGATAFNGGHSRR